MKIKFTVLLSLLVASGVYAQDDSSTKKKKPLPTKVEVIKKDAVDKADQAITNRRFRAQTGSLSDFSINFAMSYNGGSIEKPFAADRPNVSNAGDTTSIAGISGTFNGTYRVNTLNRIGLGAGIQMLAPFNDTIDTQDARAQKEFEDNKGKLDISNPYISYTHMNKFLGVQTVVSGGITQYTASNLRDVGYQNSIDFSLNTMYDFGGSPFSVGVLFLYNKFLFDNDDEDILKFQNDVVYGMLPQAEYVINDTFNLRTIVRSNWYQNNRAGSLDDFDQRPITQSVGLGISLSRDIFLYPNMQFVWQDAKAENTNLALTANINMF